MQCGDHQPSGFARRLQGIGRASGIAGIAAFAIASSVSADIILGTGGGAPHRQINTSISEPSTSQSLISPAVGNVLQTNNFGTFNLPPGTSGLYGSAYQDTTLTAVNDVGGSTLSFTGFAVVQASANGAPSGGGSKHGEGSATAYTAFEITGSSASYSVSVDLRNHHLNDGSGGPRFGRAAFTLLHIESATVLHQFETPITATTYAQLYPFAASGTLVPGHYIVAAEALANAYSGALEPASSGSQTMTAAYTGLNFSVVQSVPEPGSLCLLAAVGLMLGRRSVRRGHSDD